MRVKSYPLDLLARHKYELRRALGEEIKTLREQREASKFKALFAANATEFETSSDLAIIFDAQSYAYNQPYQGARKFNKHYFPVIGDLLPTGEEFRCAVYLDEHAAVRFWVRNADRKPNAFWLQTSGDRFFPDFMAMLVDGRILAVEYKGKAWAELQKEQEKRIIGDLWAEASDAACVFCMPVAQDFGAIDRAIAPVA